MERDQGEGVIEMVWSVELVKAKTVLNSGIYNLTPPWP
jgi:hypothetical protein